MSTDFLRREFYKISDPYTAAIVAYALALNNQASQVNALARIDQLATNESEYLFKLIQSSKPLIQNYMFVVTEWAVSKENVCTNTNTGSEA